MEPVMKKFSDDEFTKAVIADLSAAMIERGYIHLTEYAAKEVFFCTPKTVSNILETGTLNRFHFEQIVKLTKAENLKKLFARLSL